MYIEYKIAISLIKSTTSCFHAIKLYLSIFFKSDVRNIARTSATMFGGGCLFARLVSANKSVGRFVYRLVLNLTYSCEITKY